MEKINKPVSLLHKFYPNYIKLTDIVTNSHNFLSMGTVFGKLEIPRALNFFGRFLAVVKINILYKNLKVYLEKLKLNCIFQIANCYFKESIKDTFKYKQNCV